MCLEIPKMSVGSIFYHFVDARRRNLNSVDDFRAWLMGFESQYEDLIKVISEIDPFFKSISEIREDLARSFRDYFMEI